jgi:hypothetical protein
VVLTDANTLSIVPTRTALTQDNVAGDDLLAARLLDAKAPSS